MGKHSEQQQSTARSVRNVNGSGQGNVSIVEGGFTRTNITDRFVTGAKKNDGKRVQRL